MSSKYDHIKLGRLIRDKVKADLKALPGWPSYMAGKGWNGRSQNISAQDVREACEALGYDLGAAYAAFWANAAVPGGRVGPAVSASAVCAAVDANDRESDALDADIHNSTEQETQMTKTEESAEPAGFEGRDPDELVREALAPAAIHITPHLMALLPTLIGPLAEAASKGPRIVVHTETVTVNEDGAIVDNPHPPVTCKVKQRVSLATAFRIKRSDIPRDWRYAVDNIMVNVCDYPDAPAVDPSYVWNCEALANIATCDGMGMNGWWYGPAGTGKTTGMEQYAAYLGRPFVRIGLERTTEPTELVGQEVPHKGTMKWNDGKLTRAMRIPNCVILLDEPTLLRSGTLAVFQTTLDKRYYMATTGECIRCAPGVLIIVGDNTSGNGDDTGRYVDTAPINAAFLDRFALRWEAQYLPAEKEAHMMAVRTGIHAAAARIMVDYAGLTRGHCASGKLTMGITPRRLLAWAGAVQMGFPSSKAFQNAVINGSAAEDTATLAMLETQSLKSLHARIDGIARGTVDPDKPAENAPIISETALQFPSDNEGR